MNTWESRLLSVMKKARAAYGSQIAYNGQQLCAVIENTDPALVQQREYKNMRALISCGGNSLLADSLKNPAARQNVIATVGRSMGKQHAIDRTSSERSCAIFLSAMSGNDAYIRNLDSAAASKNNQSTAPQPAVPKSNVQPTYNPQPSPTYNAQSNYTPQSNPTGSSQTSPTYNPQPVNNKPAKKINIGSILISIAVMLLAMFIGSSSGREFVSQHLSGNRLTGTWRMEIDYTDDLIQVVNSEYAEAILSGTGVSTSILPDFKDYAPEVNLTVYYTFNKDNTVEVETDNTAFNEALKTGFISPLVDWTVDCIKAYAQYCGINISGYTDDELFGLFGYTKDEFSNEALSYCQQTDYDPLHIDDYGYYTVKDNRIYLLSTSSQQPGSAYITYTLKNGVLTFENVSWSNSEVVLPGSLTRSTDK
jgi:hypothetical protein